MSIVFDWPFGTMTHLKNGALRLGKQDEDRAAAIALAFPSWETFLLGDFRATSPLLGE